MVCLGDFMERFFFCVAVAVLYLLIPSFAEICVQLGLSDDAKYARVALSLLLWSLWLVYGLRIVYRRSGYELKRSSLEI